MSERPIPIAARVLLGFCLPACSCDQEATLATLVEKRRTVERSGSDRPQAWGAARVGDAFFLGDAVRTGPASTARVELGEGLGVRLAERTTLRFSKGRHAGSRLAVETGTAELESGSETVWVETDLGRVRVERGASVRLRRDERGPSLEVLVGSAVLERAGADLTLRAGERTVSGTEGPGPSETSAATAKTAGPATARGDESSPGSERLADGVSAVFSADASDLRLAVPGGVVVVRSGARTRLSIHGGTARVDPLSGRVGLEGDRRVEATGGQSAAIGADGRVEIWSAGPARAHVSITAGESPVIHDRDAPTAVRIRLGAACPAGGLVEVPGRGRAGRTAVRGTGAAVVVLPAGSHRYTVRCFPEADGLPERDVRAQGSISVRRDFGETPLAKRAARNVLDADGRSYTVLYQNLLPALTLRWPDAPAGRVSTLHFEPERGPARTVQTRTASHTFASGEIGDGSYGFWFDGAGVRSARTRLRLGFDNTAPSAQLRVLSGGEGGTLRVAGVVQDGWTASTAAGEVALDGAGRFVADLRKASEDDAVWIRIARRGRGVHYYSRHAGPAVAAP